MSTVNSGAATTSVDNELSNIINLASFVVWPTPGQTATAFGIQDSAVSPTVGAIFSGVGLTYGGGVYPTGGTITGYEVFDLPSGASQTVVTGIVGLTAANLGAYIAAGNDAALQAAIFGGADTINGAGTDDFLVGYGGADVIHAGGGNDEIVADGGLAGEVYDGGLGTDRLTVRDGVAAVISQQAGTASNFTAATFTSIEQLGWDTTSINNAIFTASQFGAGLSNTLALFGNGQANHLVVTLAAAGTLNLSGLTFNGWNGNLSQTGDQVILTGSEGADVITGTSQSDILTGDLTAAGGADILHGGAGTDLVRGGAGADQVFGDAGDDLLGVNPGDWVAGDLIDGGAGTDQLNVNGAFDFGLGTIVSIERVMMQSTSGAAPSATFSAAQVASGLAANLLVTGSALDDTVAIVATSAATVDISGWTYASWGATDKVVFTGSGAADTLTLSALVGSYAVTLGAGADTLALAGTGGGFSATNAITVNDFAAGPGLDRLELTAWLNSALQNYTPGADPFASGHLKLTQSGADTLLQVDRDGANQNGAVFSTLLTLKNVDAASMAAFNLDGFTSNIPRSAPQNGTAGADTMVGGAGADFLQGLAGNDTLRGAGGSDILDGGAGYDTALYAGAFRSYAVAVGATAVAGGPEGGADALTSVERLQFVDGYFSTEAGAGNTAGAVYRLYQTMLNRAPDSNGLANWVQAIDLKGSTLKAVANGFIGSPEFNNTYGALNNDQFVELLYSNVLHRPSDAPGKATWIGLLNSGGTRADVAIGFSESNENVNNLTPAIQKGIWVGDLNAAIAARFYDTAFDRLPDTPGLDTWTKALNAGASLTTVANGFVASQEFQTTYGALNNDQFVELMYQNVLGRASDASGKATWVGVLNGGGTRAQVVVGFSESPEHIRLTAPHIDDGVWVV